VPLPFLGTNTLIAGIVSTIFLGFLSSLKKFSFFSSSLFSKVSEGLFVSSLLTPLANNLLETFFFLFLRRTDRFVHRYSSMRLVLGSLFPVAGGVFFSNLFFIVSRLVTSSARSVFVVFFVFLCGRAPPRQIMRGFRQKKLCLFQDFEWIFRLFWDFSTRRLYAAQRFVVLACSLILLELQVCAPPFFRGTNTLIAGIVSTIFWDLFSTLKKLSSISSFFVVLKGE